MCDCKVCKEYKIFQKYIKDLPESHIDYFESLHERLINLEEDNSYYKALLEGSWPESDKVIEKWRKRYANRKIS